MVAVVGIPAAYFFFVITWGAILYPISCLLFLAVVVGVNYLVWGWAKTAPGQGRPQEPLTDKQRSLGRGQTARLRIETDM